jgi:hypothetical protein
VRPPMTFVSRTRFHIHASQLRGLAGELGHVCGGADKFAGAFRANGRGQYRSYKKLIYRSKPNLYSATRVGVITLLYASGVGTITSTSNTARQMQLTLRLTF